MDCTVSETGERKPDSTTLKMNHRILLPSLCIPSGTGRTVYHRRVIIILGKIEEVIFRPRNILTCNKMFVWTTPSLQNDGIKRVSGPSCQSSSVGQFRWYPGTRTLFRSGTSVYSGSPLYLLQWSRGSNLLTTRRRRTLFPFHPSGTGCLPTN